jgi:hypothetical protein
MAMTYKRNAAHFADAIGVEEAEGFQAWLQKNPQPKLDLAACAPHPCDTVAGVDGSANSDRPAAPGRSTGGMAEIGISAGSRG